MSHFTIMSSQSVTTFILYLALKLAFVDSAETTSCTFPTGSIACKMWNYTNMDCSQRELVCIPQLRHKGSLELLDLSNNKLESLPQHSLNGFEILQTLDLSHNFINEIHNDVLIGLNKLRTLDLTDNWFYYIPDWGRFNVLLETLSMSSNKLVDVPEEAFSGLNNLMNLDLSSNPLDRDSVCVGNKSFNGLSKLLTLDISGRVLQLTDSTFQDLLSLEKLKIKAHTVTPATFAGINGTLRFLSLSIEYIGTDPRFPSPFIHLSSLTHLTLDIGYLTCSVNDSFFIGLYNLKYLSVTVNLNALAIWLHFKSLYPNWPQPRPCHIDFSSLVSITDLSLIFMTGNPDLTLDTTQECVHALSSMNAPLETLKLYCTCHSLNSTTFEALPEWKETLKELSVYCIDDYEVLVTDKSAIHINIEGSPFKWFRQLNLLRIQAYSII